MKKRAVSMAVADWASLGREMREDTSSSTSPLSVVSSIHPFGVLPTFTRPLPPPTVVPPHSTLPTFFTPPQPIPSPKPSAISRPMEEKKKQGEDMSFIRPPSRSRPHTPAMAVPMDARPMVHSLVHCPPVDVPITANGRNDRAQKDEQRLKMETQEYRPLAKEGFIDDEMISLLDEDGKISRFCIKKMREKGITEEKVMKTINKLEEEMSARRAEMDSHSTLEMLIQRQVTKDDEHLRMQDSKSANICELLLQERSPFTENLERELKNDVGLALEMMKQGGLEPVMVSEWAERADYDEYYARSYARGVCEELKKDQCDGIIQVKPGKGMHSATFIMGDSLIEYSMLFKEIYSNELLANIKAARDGRIEMEDIADTLGLTGLDSFLSHINLNHSTAFVIVQEQDGRFVRMRE